MCKSLGDKIPSVIHYCWFGGKEKPEIFQKCLDSWKKYAPDCEIIEWNEENTKDFDHPYFRAAIQNKKWAFASDYARFKVLYEQGGVYVDTDEELLATIDSFMNYDLFLGFEKYGSNVSPMGGIIGAKPKNKTVGDFLKEYDNIKFEKERGIFDATPIPARLKEFFIKNYNLPKKPHAYHIFEFDENSAIFPANYFCEYGGRMTIAMHHYAFSWKEDVLQNRYMIFHDRVSEKHYFSIYVVPKEEMPKNINAALLFKITFLGHVIILVRQPA